MKLRNSMNLYIGATILIVGLILITIFLAVGGPDSISRLIIGSIECFIALAVIFLSFVTEKPSVESSAPLLYGQLISLLGMLVTPIGYNGFFIAFGIGILTLGLLNSFKDPELRKFIIGFSIAIIVVMLGTYEIIPLLAKYFSR